MQSWADKLTAAALAAALGVWTAAAAPPASSDRDSVPADAGPVEMQKFRLPDYNSDGTLKSEMFGDKVVMEGNVITIQNLRVELYERGKLVTSFWAESCVYNRQAGTLATDSPVRVIRSGMMMTGNGMDWKKDASEVVIRHNVRVLTIGGAEWFKVERRK